MHWRIASIDRVGHGLGLVQVQVEEKWVGTRGRRWGGGTLCRVPSKVSGCLEGKSNGETGPLGMGVGSQESKSQRHSDFGVTNVRACPPYLRGEVPR